MTTLHATAQSDYDVSKDKENSAVVFKGKISFDDLNKEPTFGWLKRGEQAYKPSKEAIAYLKKYLGRYDLVVFMGTWCDDSHETIPKLEKVLEQSAYPMTQYAMFGVDRDKTAKYVEHKLYRIEFVPIIIVMKGHMELGRITETVKKSVEDDLEAIIRPDVDREEAAAAQQQMNK